MPDFGEQLRALRSRYGLTQAALADASSLGQSTISALETGRQSPWPSTRRALAKAFRISLEEFDAQMMGATAYSAAAQATRHFEHGAGDVAAEPGQLTGYAGSAPLQAGQLPGTGARPSAAPPWRFNPPSAPEGPVGSGVGSDFRYAPTKVMELLNQLGQTEFQLKNYQSLVNQVCAAFWTTDATLHVTGAFGSVAADQRARHGEFVGRHIGEFFELAWGEDSPDFLPLIMQQRAADGQSVGFLWEIEGSRFMVFIDPLREPGGKVIGTVGLAIDVTDREVKLHRDR